AALHLDRLLPGLEGRGLAVDPRLRTRHRRIYGCGPVLGGSRDAYLARYEVPVAVNNALYLPRRQVNYRAVPRYIPTLPAIAAVGLSETQARQYYGAAALSVTVPIHQTLKAHLQAAPTGFGKLIVHQSGDILGAHWAGPEAEEIIQTIALAMTQGIRCQQLACSPPLPHTFTELLHQAAQQWQAQRWRPGCWRRDWSENWFNWRRTQQ
ncbi:mercuric reductase, partial [filamentous cyanobacterium CCP5]